MSAYPCRDCGLLTRHAFNPWLHEMHDAAPYTFYLTHLVAAS